VLQTLLSSALYDRLIRVSSVLVQEFEVVRNLAEEHLADVEFKEISAIHSADSSSRDGANSKRA
jgi:hypothetical protein